MDPVADPGFPVGEGADPLRGGGVVAPTSDTRFSAKPYGKTKELGPVGGGRAWIRQWDHLSRSLKTLTSCE